MKHSCVYRLHRDRALRGRAWLPPVAAFFAVLAFGCSSSPEETASAVPATADYEPQIAAFRQEREQSLREPDSWLTLVGLFWLREGRNSVGSGGDNQVVLPQGKAPETAGVLVVEQGKARIEVASGVSITHEGQPVTELKLEDDSGGNPTILKHGPLQFYVIERSGRLAVRVKDCESEALRNFTGLDYYPAAEDWRIEAQFEPYEEAVELEMPNYLGAPTQETSPGALVFEIEGTTYRTDAISDGPSHFLVFADSTNGSETYGGGRFLRVELPDEAAPVTLDFNKAYNPPCVFTPYATCPLPPPQNKLTASVRAGEKAYASAAH
jgi:hypothetical protein